MNLFAWQKKIRQSLNREHQDTITACAYRCPESTITQLRGTIDYDVVQTQHYENKSYLVIKRQKTHTLNVTQRRKTLNSRHTETIKQARLRTT